MSPTPARPLSLRDALPISRRVVALAIAFCLALTGCGSSDSATGSTTDKEPLTQSNFAKRMNKALVSAGSAQITQDRKSTRLNSSHVASSYAVFCLKTKKEQ